MALREGSSLAFTGTILKIGDILAIAFEVSYFELITLMWKFLMLDEWKSMEILGA